MDTNDSNLDEIYERFNAAIMNAIVNSEEIRGILKEIGGQGYINESSVFNLFLSLEELDTYMNAKSPGSPSALFPSNLEGLRRDTGTNPTEQDASATPEPPHVDGRRLTETELRYLEYCMRHFDEEHWLKKARLKL
ncbi:hypothetical protein [Nitrospina watsonii]|uniref:Uncharacterized protein n=1 Tax=Nitrospina watsonii TaxID=1323948 RepID=A0ABN8VY11_9BACT|nr:hypothetical protein [Nitrospina watsonii]CAI2718086.1 protein of unknown function [Nitrospina watsonii]